MQIKQEAASASLSSCRSRLGCLIPLFIIRIAEDPVLLQVSVNLISITKQWYRFGRHIASTDKKKTKHLYKPVWHFNMLKRNLCIFVTSNLVFFSTRTCLTWKNFFPLPTFSKYVSAIFLTRFLKLKVNTKIQDLKNAKGSALQNT